MCGFYRFWYNIYKMDGDSKNVSTLLIVVLVILGFFSSLTVTAQLTDTATVWLELTNTPPTIFFVATLGAQDAVQAGNTNISINFTAEDLDGMGDLDNVTAKATLIGGVGPSNTVRNGSCTAATWNTTSINYTCVVTLWYFDAPGDWAINVTVLDTSGAMASDQASTVTYNPVTAMSLEPNLINFSGVTSGISGSTNGPLELFNEGNVNISTVTVNITDLEAVGDIILASAFTMNENDSVGTALANETETILGWANVTAGNLTNEDIFTYVNIPTGKTQTAYTSRRAWILKVS